MENVSLLWVSTKSYNKGDSVEEHSHNFYQMQFIISGEEVFSLYDKTFNFKKNSIIFIPPLKKHTYVFNERSQILDIKFNLNEKFKIITKQLHEKFYIYINNNLNLIYIQNLINLFEYFEKYGTSDILLMKIKMQFELILLNLIDNKMLEDEVFSIKENSTAENIYVYIDNHYMEDITLNVLSEKFYFSPKYITYLIKKSYNTTPNKLIQKIRVKKGEYFILNTNHNISYIATLVGLSQNQFTYLFKKFKGITPLAYKKRNYFNIENLIFSEDFNINLEP